MRALAKELKAGDERLDLAIKKEFKAIAADVVPVARDKAKAARPNPKTPKHPGEWHWPDVAKAITAGADTDGPFVKFASDKLPGVMGFVFGSDARPQFPPRRRTGYIFFPQIDAAREEAGERIEAVVTDYLEKLANGGE